LKNGISVCHSFRFDDFSVLLRRLLELRLGEDVVCGRREAPKIFSFTFPFCWRCSGIIVGLLFGRLIWTWSGVFEISFISLLLMVFLLWLPIVLDVFFQKVSDYKSSRRRRFVSGILAGIGIVPFSKACLKVIHWVGSLLIF